MPKNPLLDLTGLPPFHQIKPAHIEPAVEEILASNRALVERLLETPEHYTWDSLIQPLEEADDRLSRAWSPVSHMNSVVNSDELRQAYNACLPKLSDYSTEMGQNIRLFEAYKSIHELPEFNQLDIPQQKTITNALRDFHLSGIDLAEDKKQRYKEIKQRLSQLTTRYEENILDATHAWHWQITDEPHLAGLPASARAQAQQTAEQKELEGWVFTLDFPSYYAVMTYAEDRGLRQRMYDAYVTRASDQGPNACTWDNSAIMDELLALRHELAQLLGFQSYAHRSLATKMAENPEQVLGFLNDLAQRSRPVALKELGELLEYAHRHHGAEHLEPWDIAYYSEKQREHLYDISDEELKPYFPESRVIPGMFEVVQRLYGVSIREVADVETWHDDVRFYEIVDEHHVIRGQFYLDLYTRQHKRGGAWMDDCISRMRRADGSIQTPVAYLTCNLTPPIGSEPALFTHDEVTTLFHEFGHGLHHMLTRVERIGVSGINGVAWDAVELPSQFMENWCWEREALNLISGHYETGNPIPDSLYKKMHAARNFQSGMQMVRQLEFSIFDFRLHLEYDTTQTNQIQRLLDEVRSQVSVLKPPVYNRFQHGFSHIFAGGYAAGYYSYKWAEVLSADAFSLFEEKGIFDHATGRAFLHNILEQGGSREPMELFIAFRGREPQIDALLRHSGIAA